MSFQATPIVVYSCGFCYCKLDDFLDVFGRVSVVNHFFMVTGVITLGAVT